MIEGSLQHDFRLVDEREAARQLGASRAALRYWRAHGVGPPWVRIGKRLVRYDVAELRNWIEQQVRMRNGG